MDGRGCHIFAACFGLFVFSGTWSEIEAESWVMHIVHKGGGGLQDPVCDAATAGNPAPIDYLTPGVPQVVALKPICLRAAEQWAAFGMKIMCSSWPQL